MTQANTRARARATLHEDMLDWVQQRMQEDALHIDPEEFLDVAIMVIHEAVDG